MYFDFPQKDFIEMVSRTLFAVSDDETRYFMNGIFLEKRDDSLIMVPRTDGGFRSSPARSRAHGEHEGRDPPPKILTIVRKLSSGEGSLSLALTDKNVFIRMGATRLSSNLIDGQFPDYRRVIPDTQKYKATMEKKSLEDALRRVSLLVEQKSRKVVFSLANGALTIMSKESELGRCHRGAALRVRRPADVLRGELHVHERAPAGDRQ